MTPRQEAADALVEALPKSAHRYIGKILNAVDLVDIVDSVEIVGARVPVETVSAYGLDIDVDANGNAVTVRSPYGLDVTA